MFTKEWKYLFLIIIIFIAACIETDIYLPAFTDMMAYFSISETQIQSLLTWNFIGICFAGPLYGPLSDSFGRKKPLMIALGLFLAGSIITLFADNFYLMLFGRILQGLGSGGCFTLGTAIIFDAFQEKEAIQALNKINSIVPVIMAGAPMLGGYLNQTYGFRSNFTAIAISVLVSFIISWFFFEETLEKAKRVPFKIKKIGTDFKRVSLSVPFWQTTVIVSTIFAGYITFLSGISVLFPIELGVSKQNLPYFQAALLGAWLAANLSFKHVLERLGPFKIKMVGTALFILGGIFLMIGTWISPTNVYLPTIAMMLYAVGANWTQGLYFPEGMEIFPDIRGITASFLTSARLLITASVVALASTFYNATIYPIAGVIFGVVLLNVIIIFFYERKYGNKTSVDLQATVYEVI